MPEDERSYYLAWQLLIPGQSRRFRDLLAVFGSAQEAFTAGCGQLAQVVGKTQAEEITKKRGALDLNLELDRLERLGVGFVTPVDDTYPDLLREIYDPPAALFHRGDITLEETTVAVVGTRRCSDYGRWVAEDLGKQLAQAGITVVSGLARGVDTAAHRGALAGKGRTVAVLGNGLDGCYPRENSRLMEDIAVKGTVVSEFPCGMPCQAWHFPVRNRVIAGLSRAVVVVEAKERSGALITADLALEQGREVMAVPGNVTSPVSCGPNNLLRQGARPVTCAADVMDALGMGFSPEADPGMHALNRLESLILTLLSDESLSREDVIQRAGEAASNVLAGLVYLEMKGLIRSLPGGVYAAVRKSRETSCRNKPVRL
ncbi:MAG: DNA-processing protein DprA [Bacillota bacterium]